MAKIRENPFGAKVYFWWILAPIFALLFCPLLMPVDSFKIAQSEIDFVGGFRSDLDTLNDHAATAFNTSFVDTGLVSWTVSDYQRAEDSGYRGYAWVGSMMDAYMRRVWLFVYRVIWRWIALWPLYLIGLVGIFIPCVADGIVVRSIKRSEFGLYNPIGFTISGSAAAVFIGWLMFIPFVPWPLGHWIVSGLFVGLGVMTWLTVGNFQSRS